MSSSSIRRKTSRFVQGGNVVVKSKKLGWWERSKTFTIPSGDDLVIESLPAVYSGRPDLLSFDMYGDNNLEWVILQYNNIVDINEEFVTGATIYIPNKDRLFNVMLTTALPSGESSV